MNRSVGSISRLVFSLIFLVVSFFIVISTMKNGCATLIAIKRGQSANEILSAVSEDIIGEKEGRKYEIVLNLPSHPSYEPAAEKYAFSSLVTSEQRRVYENIEKAAFTLTDKVERGCYTTVRADVGTLDSLEIFTVLEAVIADHPEAFWINGDYSVGTNMRNGSYIVLYSDLSYDEIVSRASELESALGKALAEIPPLLEQFDLEKRIHDLIVSGTEYDQAFADSGIRYSDSSTVYGVFVKGKAVCTGYSYAFKLLCGMTGIKCRTVKGRSVSDGTGHMWNVCNIDGLWYYVDCTWDDVTFSQGVNAVFYDYFNVTEEVILFNHEIAGISPSLSFNPPNDENLYNFPLPEISDSMRGVYEQSALKVKRLDDDSALKLRMTINLALYGDRFFFIAFDDSIDQDEAAVWLSKAWSKSLREYGNAGNDTSLNLYRGARSENAPPYCKNIYCMMIIPETN